jgi:hypothetical protein
MSTKELAIALFGATGAVGSGILTACIQDVYVSKVFCIGRRDPPVAHDKIVSIIHNDLSDISPILPLVKDVNSCLFAVGVTSNGMSEADYTAFTFGMTISVAEKLLSRFPGMSFVYVSGAGADSSEKSFMMWPRVRGRTENKLLSMGFSPACIVRPAAVISYENTDPRGPWRFIYRALRPMLRSLQPHWPSMVTTSEVVGRAMLAAARGLSTKQVLENIDINALGGGAQ